MLSAVMLMKQAMGIMPELNPIAMISQMIGTQQQALGWVVHFLIGAALWGVAFVWLNRCCPDHIGSGVRSSAPGPGSL